jgi:uncharacterized repeat protein (TIGR01451 family)
VAEQPVADLLIAKAASTATVGPGGQVLYTLVVANRGPGDATDLRVTDVPPAGVVLQSARASQGSCTVAPGGLTCALGGLGVGGSAQVLVTAQVVALVPGALVNTASVTGAQPDPDPANNTDAAIVTLPDPPPGAQPRADLTIAKEGDRRGAVGQPLEYRILVRNNGPAAATGVRVTDTLSAPARLVSVRTTAGSCRRSLPMTCSLGTIDAGGRVTITVVVNARVMGTLRNAASVTGKKLDPKTADNMAVVTTRVRRALALTKVAGRVRISAGQTVTYTIRVRNPSDMTVRNVRTCDLLPADLTYVSSKPRARPSTGRYCWTARRLGAGKSKHYRLTARAELGTSGIRTNRATATSPDTGNARARRAVRVQADRPPSGPCTFRPATRPAASSARTEGVACAAMRIYPSAATPGFR